MTIRQFIGRLTREQPLKFTIVVAALICAGFLEGLGLAMFVPLLEIIGSPGRGAAGSDVIGRTAQRVLSVVDLPLTLQTGLAVIFTVVAVQQLVVLFQRRLLFQSLFRFEADLRYRLYESFFAARWLFFVRQKTGNLVNALTAEAVRGRQAFSLLVTIFGNLAILVIYLALAAVISLEMTLIVILIGAVGLAILRRRVDRGTVFGDRITELNAYFQNEALEQIAGAKLVKGSAIEKPTVARFKKSIDELADVQIASSMNHAWLQALFEPAIVAMLCIGIYVAVTQLGITLAKLMVLLLIFYRLAPRLTSLQGYQHDLRTCLPALERIDALCEEAEAMGERGGNRRFAQLKQGLALRQVGFSYDRGVEVLADLDLEVPKGRTIAIVGGSGAGKSTVVDLIMGLIAPGSGQVLVDGIALGEYGLKSWRSKIGYVSQDTVLFHDTVKANITWAHPGATAGEIEAAARSAYAHDFIQELPHGYETIVGDRGVRLSGGQKQRLALARALITKPELLILDEATSALDAESERKIQEAVEALARTTTIVIVTHRLATVKHADFIYVLEQGRLEESGTWDQLAVLNKRFSQLRELQKLD